MPNTPYLFADSDVNFYWHNCWRKGNTLSMTYGSPVSASWNGAHRETIWYGGDARGYVSLEYDYSGGRYYTILSYGI